MQPTKRVQPVDKHLKKPMNVDPVWQRICETERVGEQQVAGTKNFPARAQVPENIGIRNGKPTEKGGKKG
jgi:hypothetical protein